MNLLEMTNVAEPHVSSIVATPPMPRSCDYGVATPSADTVRAVSLPSLALNIAPFFADYSAEPCGLPISYAPDMHEIEESEIQSEFLSISPAITIPGYRWGVLFGASVHSS